MPAPESRPAQQPTIERKTPPVVADAKRQDQPVKPPAVLLDEPPAGQAAAAKALSPSSAAAPKAEVRSPAPTRGQGLIAITPDGKFAVFTNPKSRMPEQFKVGDQLPTGENIRSIDVKDGKVVSSTKEYQLD
ncbi:hypothetical protein [Caenimonas sedimenti]|nr:hypothetical protein [Caenimonas sedimenti]